MNLRRKNLAVQIQTPGGDNPLSVVLDIDDQVFSGHAVTVCQFVGKGGTPPYSYQVITGTIPTGFPSLPSDGDWSGETASAQGHYSFVVQVADSASQVRNQRFTIDVLPSLFPIAISPLPGEVGAPYSYRFIVADETGTYLTSGYTSSGDLPDGLTLNVNGILSGTPTTVGIFYFTLIAFDGSDTITFDLTIQIWPELTNVTVPANYEPRPYVGVYFFNSPPTTYAIGGQFTTYQVQWDNLSDYPWLSYDRHVTRDGQHHSIAVNSGVFKGTPPIQNVGVRQVITGTLRDALGGEVAVEYAFTPVQALPGTTSTTIDVQGNAAMIFHVEFDDFSSADSQKKLHFPFDFQTVGVSALMDTSGDGVFDLWVTDFASYPPGSGDSICGSTPLTLTATDHGQDTALADWTPFIPAGSTMIVDASDITGFNNGSVTIWGFMGTPTTTAIIISGDNPPDQEVGVGALHYLQVYGGYPPYINLTFTPTLPSGITAEVVNSSAGGADIEMSGPPIAPGTYSGFVTIEDAMGNISNQFPIEFEITGVAVPVGYRAYRLTVSETISNDYARIAAMYLPLTQLGETETTAADAAAGAALGSESGFPADDDPSFVWDSDYFNDYPSFGNIYTSDGLNDPPQTFPITVTYDFGYLDPSVRKLIVEMSLLAPDSETAEFGNYPSTFQLHGTVDDPTDMGADWDLLIDVIGESWANLGGNYLKTYPIPSAAKYFRAWRVYCTATGGSSIFSVSEISLFDASNVLQNIGSLADTGFAYSSTDGDGQFEENPPWGNGHKAYDEQTTTHFITDGTAMPQWVAYDAGHVDSDIRLGVVKVVILRASSQSANTNRWPVDFEIQGTNDDPYDIGTVWETVHTVTGEDWSGAGDQTRTYTITP